MVSSAFSAEIQKTDVLKTLNTLAPLTRKHHCFSEMNVEQHRNAKTEIDGFNSGMGLGLVKELTENHSTMLMPKMLWRNNSSEKKGTRLNEILYKVSGKVFSLSTFRINSNYEALFVQELNDEAKNNYHGKFISGLSFSKDFNTWFSLSTSVKYEIRARKRSHSDLNRDYHALLFTPIFKPGQNFEFSTNFRYEDVRKVSGLRERGYHLIPVLSYRATSLVRFNLTTTWRVYTGDSKKGIFYNHNWSNTNVYNIAMVINYF